MPPHGLPHQVIHRVAPGLRRQAEAGEENDEPFSHGPSDKLPRPPGRALFARMEWEKRGAHLIANSFSTGRKNRIALAPLFAQYPSMLACVLSAAVNGIEAFPVEVEVNSGWGDTVIVIVGLTLGIGGDILGD
jgi:hypothetical protein